MRRSDIPLRHMAGVIATCFTLHNMCTIGKDKFDTDWIEEAERELNRRIENVSLREGQKLRVESAAIGEVRNISITKNDTRRAEVVDRDTEIFLIKKMEKMKIY